MAVSYGAEMERFIPQALDGGYAGQILFADSGRFPATLAKIGWKRLDGSYGTAPRGDPSPRRDRFAADFQASFGLPLPGAPLTVETYDAVLMIVLAAAWAGTTTDSEAIRDALREVANPPGEVVGPGVAGIARALELIAAGTAVNYEGMAGSNDFDAHGDVVTPVEIWVVRDGAIASTGRFETP